RNACGSTPGGAAASSPARTATKRDVTRYSPQRASRRGLFLGQREARRRGDTLQVAARALGLGVAVDPLPERRAVAGLEQVGQLVQQDVVDDPGGHAAQLGGQPDGAVVRGAGAPAAVLVADPAHARRIGTSVEIAVG